MEDNDKNQVLNINYFNPDRRWFIHLVGRLDRQQREKYFNPPFMLLQNSIAIKRRLILEMINNVNKEMKAVAKLLRQNEDKAIEAIKSKTTFGIQKKYQPYLYSTIGQVEAILVEIFAVTDLIIRYAQEFNKKVLGEKKKKKEIKQDMEREGIDLKWLSNLKNIRDDFVHNYSPWIRFKKINGSFKFLISLPDKLKKEYKKSYKKYPDSVLDGATVGKFYDKLNKFFQEAIDYLLKKI
jgi:hypothetical protein